MVSHVWFERVTLAVRDNAVSSCQSLCPCQQALIKASEYIALQLQARVRILESVGNSVRQLSGSKKHFPKASSAEERREPSSKRRS